LLKLLSITALALGLTAGVASADRVVVEHRAPDHHTNVIVRGGGNWHGGGSWHGGGERVVVRGGYHGGYYHGGYYGRRPIYVNRPVIREHYYNYRYRPSLIVEDYGPRPGYIWVRGHWAWDGAEWIWTPGYYDPTY